MKKWLVLLSFLAFSTGAYAQEEEVLLEDPIAEEEDLLPTDEDLLPTEEDPENADEGGEETSGEDVPETHTLKFEMTTHVQFSNPEDPSPYMEIQYVTAFETGVTFFNQKIRKDASAIVETQNWGSLAQNELFECRLSIVLDQELPVELTTNTTTLGGAAFSEENEEAETLQAVIRIDFKEDLPENWYSFCTDLTGSSLNTLGAPEHYNSQALKMVEPALNALLVDDFDATASSRIDLSIPPTPLDDLEINNIVTFSGEGSVTITPGS